MRVTRAYIAGFGTAGSLLAGLSVMFVMATSFVALRGWGPLAQGGQNPAYVASDMPLVGAGKAPKTVEINPVASEPVASRTARPAAGGGGLIVGATHNTPTSATLTTTGPAQTVPVKTGTTGTTGTGTTTGYTPPPPCTTCSTSSTGLPAATAGLTGALGAGVSATGQNLGNTVSAVGGALGTKLSAVSPAVGQLVSGVGQALGNTVTNVTANAGGALANTGQVLSGILGGLTQQH